MKRFQVKTLWVLLLLLMLPSILFAHTGSGGNLHSGIQSLFTGFFHPLLGVDHLLVLLALGLYLAAASNFRFQKLFSRFSLFSLFFWGFIAFLILGLFAGILGKTFFAQTIYKHANTLELAIGFSVLFAGMMLIVPMRIRHFGVIAFLFAFLHGSVHGVEAPHSSLLYGSLLYVLGIVLASALVLGATSYVGAKLAAKNIHEKDFSRKIQPLMFPLFQRISGYTIAILSTISLSLQIL